MVGTMDTTVSSLGLTVSSLQGSVGNMETSVGTINSTIETLQTNLGTAQGDVSTLRSEFDEHKSTYESKVDTLESSVGTLENNFSSHLETSAQQISTINENLGIAQGILTTVQEDISSVQETVSTLETDFGTVQETVSTLESSVTTLQSDYTTLQSNFSTHKTGYENKVSSLSSHVDNLLSSSNLLTNQFTNHKTASDKKISELETNVGTLQGSVDSLQTEFNTLSDNYTTLSGSVDTLRSEFDTHKGTYESKVDTLDLNFNNYTSVNDNRISGIEQNHSDFTTEVNDRLNSLEQKDYDSQLQTLSGDVRNANITANEASRKASDLEDVANEFHSTIETITWPDYAYICDLSGGFWSKENIWDPDSNVYPGFCNSCGEASYQLRAQDFENIDVNQERILAYLYIPNEYMLTETFQFIKKFNDFCDSYHTVHDSYPYVDGGLTIFLHSSELGYHARNAVINEHPEYTFILRDLFKHTCRICILAAAFMKRPHYTEMMNSQFERHNSFNGQNLAIPIFSDSKIKVIDFDTSFAWDYLDLGFDFYVDDPFDSVAITQIKRIQFPRELKILNLTSAYYDLDGNELYDVERGEWSLNGFIETLDLPETLWKCFIRIPYNTLKTVYLPINPDKFELAYSYGNLNYMKATHINYKRTFHNETQLDYDRISDTHTLYGLSSNSGAGDAEDITKTKNCAGIMTNSVIKTYVDVNDLSLDIIGTSNEPGGISLFILNDYANYDFDKFLAMFDKGFYFAGTSYYNILTEKFMVDMFNDSSNWHKFKIPFNNRFDTLVIDMNNFKDTGKQLITFRFEAPARDQTTTLAKYNTFQSLAIRNADYPTSILISSRASGTSATTVPESLPYVGNYGTLYNWSLPPAKELKIDMVHPVRLSYIDTTPYYRTEIQQLYLDARCVIKIKDAYVFIKKIYYTSEDKKPKLVSDLLTEDELASYEAKCELLPFV